MIKETTAMNNLPSFPEKWTKLWKVESWKWNWTLKQNENILPSLILLPNLAGTNDLKMSTARRHLFVNKGSRVMSH